MNDGDAVQHLGKVLNEYRLGHKSAEEVTKAIIYLLDRLGRSTGWPPELAELQETIETMMRAERIKCRDGNVLQWRIHDGSTWDATGITSMIQTAGRSLGARLWDQGWRKAK